MINVNLLPAKQKEEASNERFKLFTSSILYLVAAILAVVAVLLFFITKISQQNKIEDLQTETQNSLTRLGAEPEIDKLLTIQNQLDSITGLHDEKASASRMFEYLDKIVPTDVTLTSIEVGFDADDSSSVGSESGKIVVGGITRDFKTLNTFVDIIKNAEFTAKTRQGEEVLESEKKKAFDNVITEQATPQDQVTLTFSLEFEYDPQLFDFTVNQIVFSVPSIITSVSEQERPSGLFVDNPYTEPDNTEEDL